MSPETSTSLGGLPGAQLFERGVEDLAAGRLTVSSALVSMAAQRLRDAGLTVPKPFDDRPSHALYHLLAQDDPRTAHSSYNALVGRIVSFARAAEHARAR